jgi:hypothetical protein
VLFGSCPCNAIVPWPILAPALPIGGLCPLHHFFAVQFDRDGLILHKDALREPLVVLRDSLDVVSASILDMVKAVGLDGIPISVIHLNFNDLRAPGAD